MTGHIAIKVGWPTSTNTGADDLSRFFDSLPVSVYYGPYRRSWRPELGDIKRLVDIVNTINIDSHTMYLLRSAVKGQNCPGIVDIDAWAKKLANDVKDADD